VSLRIGFDLDGVLADMESELTRQARALFGEQVTGAEEFAGEAPPVAAATEPPDGAVEPAAAEAPADSVPPLLRLNITPRQERKLWAHVGTIENFWLTLSELEPGVVGRLAALAAERRWELIFLTKRPDTLGATAQVQSQRWLESKGFPLPSVYVVQGSRGRIAAALALDIVVDDRPENCLDVVVDSSARAILVWREDEERLPAAARRLGIGVVKTVGECLDVLTQADTKSSGRAGVINRMKRLLGLKEPANA
jgi:hypothetical protein